MTYSTRAIVPPNGFVPNSGRRVAATDAPPWSSFACAGKQPSKAFRMRNENTSPYHFDSAVKAKAMAGVPMCGQRAHLGSGRSSWCAYDMEEEQQAMGGVPMRRRC
ncbi:hypothetical protein C8F01DRAFT_1261845 [Mycena amicta]|nr:hypothetical protein C8F01DRAFT_1261845 [Mycena amicta]